MKLLEHLPRRGIKYIVFGYVFISLVYTATRFYNISDTFHHTRTARRSVIEPNDTTVTKDTFFIAPLAQEVIETDEYEELVKTYINDHQNSPLGLITTMSKGKK